MRDRRSFLSSLAALPLIGGGVTLIGKPTAAAVPVTEDLLWPYKSWLFMEHRMLSFELAGHDKARVERYEPFFKASTHGSDWHLQWSDHGRARGPAGWIDAPQPSTRAAVVLSAVGCPLTAEPNEAA